MSGALIEGKIEDQGVLTQLAEIRERTENMRPVWSNIGQILLESIMRNFLDHRAPDGESWREVSKPYARWKSKQNKKPSDILVLSTVLRNSINPRPDNDSVTIGTNVVYAAIHQFGGTFGRRSDLATRQVVGERTQTLAFDESGRFMSRKKASRRKTGSTRIVIAKVGGHAMDMPARKFLGAREDDWGRISTALEKYIVTGQV